MRACLVSLWPSSFAQTSEPRSLVARSLARYHFSLRSALPLRLSTLAHRSGSNFVVRRPSLSPFPRSSHPTRDRRRAFALLSSLLLFAIYVRIAAVDRPTDRPTDRSPSVQCWRQCSSKKPPPSSDCRHTTDRCYRVVVAAAVTTTSTYQRKFSSSKGEKTYPLIAQLTRFTISDLR